MYKMDVIDIFAAFYIREKIVLAKKKTLAIKRRFTVLRYQKIVLIWFILRYIGVTVVTYYLNIDYIK